METQLDESRTQVLLTKQIESNLLDSCISTIKSRTASSMKEALAQIKQEHAVELQRCNGACASSAALESSHQKEREKWQRDMQQTRVSHQEEMDECRRDLEQTKVAHQNEHEEWKRNLKEGDSSHRKEHTQWQQKMESLEISHKQQIDAWEEWSNGASSKLDQQHGIVIKLVQKKKELKCRLREIKQAQRSKKQCLGDPWTTGASAVNQGELE
jgi:hypothetical protein